LENLELDDPQLTARRGKILKKKKFLRQIYEDWYRLIKQRMETVDGLCLELGSGAGFIDGVIDGIYKSDIMLIPRIHLVLDSIACPLADGSVAAIAMVDVLHHIPRAEIFFSEVARVLVDGGLVVMIEPWITGWSKWVYTHLHHESTIPTSPEWHFESSGPLSGANQALPWIIFERDRPIFERKFSSLEILEIQPMMPLRYLLSGGFTTLLGAPGWMYPLFKGLDNIFPRAGRQAGMFALIVLRKSK